MKILVTAGGTGGHIYPALAIINQMKKKDKNLEVLYVGTTDRIEKDIVPKCGIDYVGIEIKGLIRKLSFQNVNRCCLAIKSLSKAKKIINEYDPDVIIGAGGYVTAPILYMGRKLGYKTLIHEQNIIPGLTNKLLGVYANKICVSFEEGKQYFSSKKTVYTGNPTSQNYLDMKPMNKEDYGLDNKKKLILIVMGSLGSMTIINKMKEYLPKLNSDVYEVVFVSGPSYYDEISKVKVPKNVKVVPIIENMGSFMKKTDIMVSRAGASTIAEIMTLNVPTIFVPSPYVTNNHQFKNAQVLTSQKAGLMLEEKDFSLENLLDKINYYLDEKNLNDCKKNLEKFKKTDAAEAVANEILKLKEEL